MSASTVRAVVMKAPGRVEVERFPLPDPEPGSVLMRVLLSGICGTDKHSYRGETTQYAGTGHARRVPFPIIPGHENVGMVVATGGEVLADDGAVLVEGDRIVPGANVPCGACYFCRNGLRYYLCENLEDYGDSLSSANPPHLFGGWSEHMYLLPGSRIFRVPDSVPDQVAVLTEPMAVTHGLDAAWRTIRAGGGSSESPTLVVLGLGPLGLCHLIKAMTLGVSHAIVLDRFPERLEVARNFGAGLTLDASATAIAERRDAILERCNGVGADVVADCSGLAETLHEAMQLVRPGGVVVEAGAFVDVGTIPFNPADLCTRDVTLIGVGGETAEEYGAALDAFASTDLPLDRAVTHRFELDRAAEAIDISQSGAAMKVALDPTLGASLG